MNISHLPEDKFPAVGVRKRLMCRSLDHFWYRVYIAGFKGLPFFMWLNVVGINCLLWIQTWLNWLYFLHENMFTLENTAKATLLPRQETQSSNAVCRVWLTAMSELVSVQHCAWTYISGIDLPVLRCKMVWTFSVVTGSSQELAAFTGTPPGPFTCPCEGPLWIICSCFLLLISNWTLRPDRALMSEGLRTKESYGFIVCYNGRAG